MSFTGIPQLSVSFIKKFLNGNKGYKDYPNHLGNLILNYKKNCIKEILPKFMKVHTQMSKFIQKFLDFILRFESR